MQGTLARARQTTVDEFITPSNSIQFRFEVFHENNPHVYENLVRLARDLRKRGHRKIGMKMLFEVLRWASMLKTTGEAFKLSNDFTSRYARLIEAQEPDLRDFFELRRLES